ncbi:MAG: hypothetical protein K6E50_03705 [Lachnospiraceae bacterium]|nr:hypothetical protein [Lachnospiraceae bacterium]
MNRGNTDMTAEMPPPAYPLMCLLCGDMEFNEMQAYTSEQNILRMNEHITPLGTDRRLDFRIDLYGEKVEALSFQLRSLQDGRLIEESQIFDYAHAGECATGSATLKDLMKEGSCYSLCFLLQTQSGKFLRYYTRVIPMAESNLWSKLDFAFYFHETSFEKEKAKKELPTWLESNKQGDNSSFTHVDIHSSSEQVSWGSLELTRPAKTRATVREIDADSAQIRLDYLLKVKEGDRDQYCFVEEYYRMRLGKERIYLLEYERDMEQIFNDKDPVIVGNKIQLGIISPELERRESEDGHILAFANCGRLFTYDSTGNKLASVFGFYGDNMADRRALTRKNDIRIFRVEETGDVLFAVYGYMSCGIHEGSCGIVLYEYDSMQNSVEEQLFVPYDGDPLQLMRDMDHICFAGERSMHILRDDRLYELGIQNGGIRLLAEGVSAEGVVGSESGEMMAWSSGSADDEITLKNMQSGNSSRIEADPGDKLYPITFFGSDLVYGIAKGADITRDESGHELVPMYALRIRNEQGRILKEYRQDGIYVTGIRQNEGMITLIRMSKNEEGMLVPEQDDQILDNNNSTGNKNYLESVVTERFETIQQLVLRSEVNTSTMQFMEPKQVIFEGDRSICPDKEADLPAYYNVFARGRLSLRTLRAYDAVNYAWETGGTVRDDAGTLLYCRTSLPVKNQIMAISGGVHETGDEKQDELALCIDTWLNYEGTETETLPRLKRGASAATVLQSELPGAKVLDLSGVLPETVLYYVANEKPVLAELDDGSGMLLIGYNEVSVVVLEPGASEQVHKISRTEAGKIFAASGNRFLTFVMPED